jgi:prophage regulatory protein
MEDWMMQRRHQPTTRTDSNNDVVDDLRACLATAEEAVAQIADASRVLNTSLSRASGLLDAIRRTQAGEHERQAEPAPVKTEAAGLRVLRMREVLKMVGLCRSSVWRLERLGLFPKSRKLSPRAVGWIAQEVEDWVNGERRG